MQNKQVDELINEINLSKIENKKKEVGNFVFIPIENKNGFIVYSKGKINEIIKEENISLFEKFKNDYINCKDYKKINDAKETYTHRYYYYEKISDENETITIIMLNPAFAYSKNTDDTIENIKDFINNENKEKIGAFEIINLYSIRMPKSAKLNSMLNTLTINEDNDINTEFIKQYIKGSINKILIAWGAAYHNKAIKQLEKNIKDKQLYCYALTDKSKIPRHFSSCSYNQAKNKKLMKFSF